MEDELVTRPMVQIVVMDSKNYIIDYKDFKPNNRDGINIYIWTWMVRPEAHKINIRKW